MTCWNTLRATRRVLGKFRNKTFTRKVKKKAKEASFLEKTQMVLNKCYKSYQATRICICKEVVIQF